MSFPNIRHQWIIAVLLAALMLLTRGEHFASVHALPSASWAVLFLAGFYLRPLWAVPALFALGSLIDLGSLAAGTISDWCLSPAYWALLLAYTALWGGGRLLRRHSHGRAADLLVLALALAGSALLGYLCSGGGFYFFSGRYEDASLIGFGERILRYYPGKLAHLSAYVGLAALIELALRLAGTQAHRQHSATR
ncbi:MAG: hypothetical protein K0U79_16185 [Gammaproteobacteria bacterium]|nr:hypothetical protein [Gammaproteobacteria bacterium]